ncbi:anti-phage dCTP deaminase [Ralstonia pseudosolanacearum]|uniref:anti-phage dCTP deaminase n=1 Tax=Ralstonia pseudosolanacearum TaxID=1310165 RepID=UPI003393B786
MAETAVVKFHVKQRQESTTKEVLERRASKELVIAFMGPAGCGLPRVITECEGSLRGMGYDVVRVKLSDFIKKNDDQWRKEVLAGDVGVDYLENQTGGNVLRRDHDKDILAQYAVNLIARSKIAKDKNSADRAHELPRVAYLVDQIKHPEEASLLRLIYRNLFYLIGVLSTEGHRLARLKDSGLEEAVAKRIMERDRKEVDKNGQQLEKAFKLADYFIQHPLGRDDAVPKQISRFLRLVHGHNSVTPTKHEHAMYVAHATGLRSACFSRQVGAAILDARGKLLGVGCNDVPQYGGGLYTVESKDDKRCANLDGKICENDSQKSLRRDKIKEGLISAFPKIIQDEEIRGKLEEKVDAIVELAYQNSGIPDLIEFSRAVHAEMDAIVSVARQGGVSTVGSTLYTTTFPCHNCARHIVAAGIDTVYYIEPYEKSLALISHSDSITVLDHDGEIDGQAYEGGGIEIGGQEDKVKFIHFAGVAPRLYAEFFFRDNRKNDEGRFLEWYGGGGEASSKIMVEYLDSYRDFEIKVSQGFEKEFPVE